MIRMTLLAMAIAALFASGVQPASATPILAGQSAIFNFDYTGSNPPAPYQQIATQIDMDSFVIGATVTYEWFSQLNGGGTQVDSFTTLEGFHILIGGFQQAGLVDGVYSLKVIAHADLDIQSLEGYFANAGDQFYTFGANGTLAVPEPASLLLFLTGLLGLSWIGQRRSA